MASVFEDAMASHGQLHTRVLRVVLRSHMSNMYLPLSRIVANAFDKEFGKNVRSGDKWAQLPMFSSAKRVIAAANVLALFGPDLAEDPIFLESAITYTDHLLLTAEILRLVPSILHPLIGPILLRTYQGSKTMVEYITPVVEERLHQANNGGWASDELKPKDCIQFFVDAISRSKDKWPATKIVQVLLSVWFASVHQPALTAVYALEDLCQYAEYVEPLQAGGSLYRRTRAGYGYRGPDSGREHRISGCRSRERTYPGCSFSGNPHASIPPTLSPFVERPWSLLPSKTGPISSLAMLPVYHRRQSCKMRRYTITVQPLTL